jgi:hypothetical protein
MNARMADSRWQLLISLLLFGGLLALALLQGTREPTRPYDLESTAPDGLLALRLWLSEMGYDPQETVGEVFQVPAPTALLLVYPSTQPYTEAEAVTMAQWVLAGGTAVIIGPQHSDTALIEQFGVAPGEPTPLFFSVVPRQPLLPTVEPLEVSGAWPALDLGDAPHAVAILQATSGEITAAVQTYGAGTVWHLSRHHTLTNGELRDAGQATLTLALLRSVPAGGVVRFDTYHLWGARSADGATVNTLQEWLYYTPWGWALLFAALLTALVLILQGRRLGPPLPAQAEVRRREAAEYVIAMANLARRARHRQVVTNHHKRRLKRVIGQRVHVDATLPDETFVDRLAAQQTLFGADQPTAAAATVQRILAQLDRANDDRALIAAIEQVDQVVGWHPTERPPTER